MSEPSKILSIPLPVFSASPVRFRASVSAGFLPCGSAVSRFFIVTPSMNQPGLDIVSPSSVMEMRTRPILV